MIPAAFDYEVAESVEHALALLGGDPDAKVLAGGHSLVPALKLRVSRPSKLVDIGRLAELAYVREDGDRIAIGALTRHAAVQGDALLREQCSLVSSTAGQVGDPQVRHRGTIGGSLAYGDPASDLPAVMLALDADFVIASSAGSRTVSASDFFTGVFQTAVAHGELLTEIRVPKLGAGTGSSYLKYHRRAQDWATVGVAAVVRKTDDGTQAAAVALTNMAGTPVRAAAVEAAVNGGAPPAEAAAHAADGTDPSSDTAASAEFRKHLARVLTERALTEALR